MQNNGNYGLLIHRQDILIQRNQFKEATKFLGIEVIYKQPLPGKNFNGHGDLNADYDRGMPLGCFFHEHPSQKTIKKIGWVSELSENSSLIEVPYDTPNLQVGCLFIIPSGIDHAEGRVFRVVTMENIMVSPISMTLEIAPEYETNDVIEQTYDYSNTSFTRLVDLEGDD